MCGRFTLRTSNRDLVEQFLLPGLTDLQPRHNICPTQAVATVRKPARDAPRELVMMRWGLVPSWADDPKIGNRMINARSETAAEKPSFRTAMKRRRCLILADGFYEWKTEGKKKKPHCINLPDGRAFAFAGLWEHWKRGDQALTTCTILTTSANAEIEPLHDRMPVILNPADYDVWLDPALQDPSAITRLMRPYPDGELTVCEISQISQP